MVLSKYHQSQWLLQDMICFLVSFCLIFSPCMLYGAFFFRHYFIFSMFFFYCLDGSPPPPSVSCRLTDQAAFVMSVTASPSHHQCLTLTLALIFSQLPHPECWMPRLPLEASPPPRLLLACFACLVPWCWLGSRVHVVALFVS